MSLDEIKPNEAKIEPPVHTEVPPAPEDVYSTETLPKTPLQEKVLRGEKLSLSEAIEFGRDKVLSGEVGEGISTRPDRAYRGVS
ncbi:MAG: hypothetical protein NUV54_02560, partial [Candidatus Taylorbacteria bacterium]|nr:hypothetical protein [Candidatus Taylorbacteria bacterium]